MATVELQRRYETIAAVEDSKDNLIQCLFDRIEDLEAKLAKTKEKLKDNKVLCDNAKAERAKCENELENMRHDKGKLSFISVLVDGDCMNFKENLVQDGELGGHEAARLLLGSVENHLRNFPVVAGARCRIRLYANVHGLTKAYRDAGILRPNDTLQNFIQGFNKENGLCDFVDAGSGKECVDTKLKHIFEQDMNDVHCLRVIFCASADNGYARILAPYRETKRISLIEGPPFAKEIRDIADKFDTASFLDVFRPTKLVRKVSFSGTLVTPPVTPPSNYASAAALAPQTPLDTKPLAALPSSSDGAPNVLRNKDGHRIDCELQYSTRESLDRLRDKKLCNYYHILGHCHYSDCNHEHGNRIGGYKLTDLRYIARSSPCTRGLYCGDPKCFYGHRCMRDGCSGGDNCRFPSQMHGIDIKLATPL